MLDYLVSYWPESIIWKPSEYIFQCMKIISLTIRIRHRNYAHTFCIGWAWLLCNPWDPISGYFTPLPLFSFMQLSEEAFALLVHLLRPVSLVGNLTSATLLVSPCRSLHQEWSNNRYKRIISIWTIISTKLTWYLQRAIILRTDLYLDTYIQINRGSLCWK